MAKRSKRKKGPPEVNQARMAVVKETVPGESPGVPWTTIVQVLVIAAAVVWIYWPSLCGDWLWDDDQLVANNALVHDPYGLWKIWFQPGSSLDFQPLKGSVVWLQWLLWGSNTLGYHLTNVFLHIVGALLVWRLLSKFGLRRAWLGGLIFAIHPVQVESVAWIAELKNTLSLPPFLLAMCAWLDYDERGKERDYFLSLGLFLTAMLCKPTMVMFPVVILLYAWWKRGRIGWKDVKASAPFFVVSLVLGLVTAWFLHHYAVEEDAVTMGGFFSRLACAGLAIAFYFSKCFLPLGLLPIYPLWVIDPPTPWQFLPWPILLAVIYWLWTKRGSWGRHALLGLGFFLINLALFIGFNAAAYMKYTWVMDHLLYIPIIGLIGLVVAASEQMEKRLFTPIRYCGIGLATGVMLLLAWLSHAYAAKYLNSETLWTYELQHNSEAYLAHNNLGTILLEHGRIPEAIEHYEEALRIDPDFALANNNLGNALLDTGRTPEAIEHYERAVRVSPDNSAMHYNLGGALLRTGRTSEAIEQFELALRIDPTNSSAHFDPVIYARMHYTLGNTLQHTGRLPEATEQYEQAVQLQPDNAEARYSLGNALFQTGRLTEAIEQYEQDLRIEPNHAEAHGNLGLALQQSGRLPEAIDQYKQALLLQPEYAEAHYNLGNALYQTGQLTEAIDEYEEALRVKPDYVEAHDNLGVALYRTGRKSAAMEQFEQALHINPNNVDARKNLAQLQALQQTAPPKP
jgi:tetratricopeptide (TPR) repeat protein